MSFPHSKVLELKDLRASTSPTSDFSAPFSVEDVDAALRKMKKGTIAGAEFTLNSSRTVVPG